MTDKKKKSANVSALAGVDEELFANRKPSEELKAIRKVWDKEFEKRIK